MSGDRWKIVRIPDGRGEGEPEKLDWTAEDGAIDEAIEPIRVTKRLRTGDYIFEE